MNTTNDFPIHSLQNKTFIDLFAGIGGFHLALSSLGAKCIFACEIDKHCRDIYQKNFGITPFEDVTKIQTDLLPPFDILCAGFPCQSFSHAGKQDGFYDTRGTLFYHICRLLKDCQPEYFILENVKNLKNHDQGRTLGIMYDHLHLCGYTIYNNAHDNNAHDNNGHNNNNNHLHSMSPLIVSPHHLGIPQHRERVFLIGIREDRIKGRKMQPFPFPSSIKTDISSILEPFESSIPSLSSDEMQVLYLWEEFIKYFKKREIKLPSFPLWTEEWDSSSTMTDLPLWKQRFILKNRMFYEKYHAFLTKWLEKARQCSSFVGSRRKLEWQCGFFEKEDSLWTLLFTFRPSGIRVKRSNYSPALVAMSQIVHIGSRQRKLTVREVARLQSFPDSFVVATSASIAYKQFGNAVNVHVVRHIVTFLFTQMLK
uniref:DNA (cytosine-5-)-methyltransferase n=1 Tax=viral metagenome TaxID=1070528 RepID=A0A6C0D0C7_9ZZZZ